VGSLKTSEPNIEKYLASGMMRGIGPVPAARIVAAWAEQKVVWKSPGAGHKWL
jgi:hypothetical protein